MRVLGLIIDDHSWFFRNRVPGLPAEEAQRAAIRRWAVENGHELLSIHEYTSSSHRVAETYLAGTIQAALIATERVLDAPLHLWPEWIAGGIGEYRHMRVLDRGIPQLIATDTGQPVDVIQRRWTARRAVPDPPSHQSIPLTQNRRMQSARRDKKAKGGYAFGAPPFGWIAYQGWLLPDVDEQETRTRALQLREEGKTLRQVCDLLDAEGFSTRSGARWTSGTLSRILDRPPPPPESIHPPTEPYTDLYDKAVAAKLRRAGWRR
ncbi:recombinase family protein [Streptomyces sp. NPDC093801]|uniref:recombinase family protein n=1 Tax=Streptomyces sp. NPDC093801 TaxID=3155203 RepID=UPI0034501898